MMALKKNTFESVVFKELDLVWKTYVRRPLGVKIDWVRRVRTPKRIHIYWGKEFLEALQKTLDCNPLMHIIMETIGDEWMRYYPIYSRHWTWYRIKDKKTSWNLWTYYDKVNRVWDYADNMIDCSLDEVVWWYPPILTWLFTERPSSEVHWDLLIYLIKKRHANKKKYSSEAIDWGTKGESTWSSEES